DVYKRQLEGMLLNGLADHILFEATNAFYDEVCRVAKAKNLYPSVRKEPGLSDVPIEDQKRLYDSLVVPLGLDFELTEGYMLSPTKSLLYYYTLSEAPCELGLDHDCGGCAQPCNMQTHTIKVTVGDKMTLVKGRHGERLLDVLRKNGILISASCGGARLCGKCRVQIKGRRLPLMEGEKHFLSGKEIEEGVVLACFHTVDQAMEVHVPSCHDDNNLISEELSAFEVRLSRYTRSKDHYEKNTYGIAVDIGTTTLAIGVVSLLTGEVMAVKKCLNPQGSYGADIISRIQYTIDNPEHQLGILIRGAIRTLMDKAIAEMALTVADVKHMVVSGNTTMIYLLLGLNPAPLAAAPFETLNLGIHTTRGESLFGSCYAFPVTTLPWVSAYVGGDIVSGLYANDLIHKQGHWLYLDIGTNGEMVLKSGRRLICAATAAGPAFEGANIRCGIGPVAGAICEVIPKQGHHAIVTLGKEEAIGLCGSGLLDIVAILRNEGRIESGGYMKEPYALTDTIVLYPEDVRQVQLAKGAIRAGADVLLKASGITADELNGILLAGGFGSHIH
ncbi:MAG: ASKHA domain-containing protein, partial [Clostridia bacterium]|nr:ASKHA domain-containing protein [Clostridia bacterium]